MKTKFAKLFSSFAMMATFCFTSVVAQAAEISDNSVLSDNDVADSELVLITDETYELDDGWIVTVKGYKESENSEGGISTCSAESGSDYYKYYYKFTQSAVGQSWDWLEMWVWGTFTWDTANDTVYVTNAGSSRNILHTHPTIVSDTGTVSKDNQGATFLLGKRYGVVSRTIVMHNGSELNNTFTLSLDVNVNGEVHSSPTAAVQV